MVARAARASASPQIHLPTGCAAGTESPPGNVFARVEPAASLKGCPREAEPVPCPALPIHGQLQSRPGTKWEARAKKRVSQEVGVGRGLGQRPKAD